MSKLGFSGNEHEPGPSLRGEICVPMAQSRLWCWNCWTCNNSSFLDETRNLFFRLSCLWRDAERACGDGGHHGPVSVLHHGNHSATAAADDAATVGTKSGCARGSGGSSPTAEAASAPDGSGPQRHSISD